MFPTARSVPPMHQGDSDGSNSYCAKHHDLSDEEIIERVLAGETALFEIVISRYNRRLYRTSRAILWDDTQAEDVIQDAYLQAYQHLGQFARRAKFSTWLIRIAINEALARVRHCKRYKKSEPMPENNGDRMGRFISSKPDPEEQAASSEIRRLLEQWIDGLPESYRAVFVLRDVEEMSTTETALALEITEENVKTRLHRARALLRKSFYVHARVESREAFAYSCGEV